LRHDAVFFVVGGLDDAAAIGLPMAFFMESVMRSA